MEQHEGSIEDWYFQHQGKISLRKYLCEDQVLSHENVKCLYEELKGDKGQRKKQKEKNEL